MTEAVQDAATNAESPEEVQGTEEQQRSEEDVKKLRRQAYGAATSRLREQYRAEFDDLYSQEAEALGIEVKPRLTPEQKAEQEMRDLLEKYPHLAQKFTQ